MSRYHPIIRKKHGARGGLYVRCADVATYTYVYIHILFRWSLCLSCLGCIDYRLQISNGWWALRFFQLHQTSSDFTFRMPPKGNLVISTRVCSVGYIGTWGIFGGRTALTELSGTGIEVIPNLPYCRVPVSSSYRAIPSMCQRYTLGLKAYRTRP